MYINYKHIHIYSIHSISHKYHGSQLPSDSPKNPAVSPPPIDSSLGAPQPARLCVHHLHLQPHGQLER